MPALKQEVRFARAADGTRIAFAGTGAGYPLVNAAHWLGHVEFDWQTPVWLPWIERLGARWQLTRYDSRGCGLSDRDVAAITLDDLVSDLEAVVAAAGLDRFALLGSSQGGAISIAYAARHPERVSHRVLSVSWSVSACKRATVVCASLRAGHIRPPAMRDDAPSRTTPFAGKPAAARAPWRRIAAIAVVAAIAAAIAGWYALRPAPVATPPGERPAGRGGRFDASRPMPVSAAAARSADLPVRLTALGTVTARYTVTVRSRVDGQLLRVYFKEGGRVKAGQLLAQIDPKPFQVALEQAEAQQARDRAQLDGAKVDLARYRGLLSTDSIARQQVDQQQALVRQLEATVAVDQAAADNARLQVSYTRIAAPVSGRIGLRQVDPGNLVSVSDANGLVVVTQVEPIDVRFSLPQESLPKVLARLRSGATLPVDAYSADSTTRLASGRLLTVDNLIDPATGTVKMKTEFDNTDNALFPNQFVNVRLLLDTLKGAIAVPTSAIQRGAPGTYVYVVGADSTVTVRKVTLGPSNGETTALTAGLAAGERVVTDGAGHARLARTPDDDRPDEG